MPDMMAIVSKAIFEKAAGKEPSIGTKLQMDRYVSANKALAPLASGGKLYLVTVRPPDEALWLVAVLESPHFDGTQWIAKASQVPITDISPLRSRIKFESGIGITAKKGALGMSLQTPRALTTTDTALLDGAYGVSADDADGLPSPPSAPSPIGATTGERRGSLLDAILENPASDEARQVYADQLISKNDPRGELILVEIALAGPLSIRKRGPLTARRNELIEQHAATWWPFTAGHWRTHKGFLSAMSGTWKQIQLIAPKVF
ncbi:MAG TPA: TIGR02996 domain-containing protein, partial [Kofleriaceae bacterium]|nr:TIGR02996 domain-containing protein [Kofleriaceae bacterium]